jgi:hypothetical protein
VARETHTPIEQVEQWEIDKLLDYSASIARLNKQNNNQGSR